MKGGKSAKGKGFERLVHLSLYPPPQTPAFPGCCEATSPSMWPHLIGGAASQRHHAWDEQVCGGRFGGEA